MSSQNVRSFLQCLYELECLELKVQQQNQDLEAAREQLAASRLATRSLREARLLQKQEAVQILQLTLQGPTVNERRWLLQTSTQRELTPSEERLLRHHHWLFRLVVFLVGLIYPSFPGYIARLAKELRDQAHIERLQRLAHAQAVCKRIEWELREDADTEEEWDRRWNIEQQQHTLRLMLLETVEAEALLGLQKPHDHDEETDEPLPQTEANDSASPLASSD